MCPELEGLFLRRTTFKIVVENYSVDGRDILLTTNLSRPRCSSAHLIARSKRVIFMIFMPEIVRRDVQNQCRSILPLSSESLRYSPHVEGRGCFHEGNKQVLTALKKKKTLLRAARGTHRFLNGDVVANCYANEERLDTPTGRAAGSRSTTYD